MIWRQRYKQNALSFLNQKVGIALSMETILHVHCVGWCIPLKGRLQLYAFCNTNHHGKWKQHVISPQLAWKQRAATHCNLPVFQKNGPEKPFQQRLRWNDLHSYGQFSWIVACGARCINRLHRRINVSVCGLFLPLGAEIALTLVAWKWTLGGHPFWRACPFLDLPGKEKQFRVCLKMGFRRMQKWAHLARPLLGTRVQTLALPFLRLNFHCSLIQTLLQTFCQSFAFSINKVPWTMEVISSKPPLEWFFRFVFGNA